MRKLFVLICAVAICLTAQAQKTKKGLTTQNVKIKSSKTTAPIPMSTSGKHYNWEIGLLAGSSVYTGDVHCEKFFLKALNFGGGLFARYYFSDNFTTRLNLQTGRINGNDVNYGTADHIARGFSFNSQILEASALLEYEPFAKRRYRGGQFHRILSPYVNVGIGYLYSMPKTSYNEANNDKLLTQINADKKAMTHGHIALPFGAGIRYDLSRKVSIGLEGAFRMPFTDYLDGVSQAANPKTNDWYYTGNVLLAYRFSHKMDSDNDGVNDDEDKCPNVPGVKSNKGCPQEEKKSVQKEDIEKEKIAEKEVEKTEGIAKAVNESPKDAISETTNTTKEVMADSDTKMAEKASEKASEKVIEKQVEMPAVSNEVVTTEKGKTITTTPTKVAANLKQPTSTITKTSTKESAAATAPIATNTKVETVKPTTKTTAPNRSTAAINEANVISRGQYVDYSSVRIEAPGANQSYTSTVSTSTKGYTPTSYTNSSTTTSNSTTGYFAAPTYDGINAESATTFREAMYGVKFKTGSAAVSKESYGILNRVAKVIKTNNDHITISGHTDNQGCASENQNLSELRAFSIYKYLILKGIPSNRISYEGFGDTQPLNDNCAESGRAKNRRVEFRLQ